MSGKIKPTITSCVAKGYGIISQIISILEELPFGYKRIKAGLLLRQTQFLNGIIFDSECWHGVLISDVIRFELLDIILIRQILGETHSKTPIEFLYQETSIIPIWYIMASRRILYLYNILNKHNN